MSDNVIMEKRTFNAFRTVAARGAPEPGVESEGPRKRKGGTSARFRHKKAAHMALGATRATILGQETAGKIRSLGVGEMPSRELEAVNARVESPVSTQPREGGG